MNFYKILLKHANLLINILMSRHTKLGFKKHFNKQNKVVTVSQTLSKEIFQPYFAEF